MSATDDLKERLIQGALRFSSLEARQAYLEGACGSDRSLLEEIETSLEARLEAQTQRPKAPLPEIPALLAEDEAQLIEKPGDRIGRYKLLEKLGEGGFGSIYLAEQEEPVRRRVALKIIKLGMDTRSVVARFEAERQALALMDHPNIATVLDGGATSWGRPYFAMELVKGVPITEYCNQHKLSTQERLALFILVCGAIQHAHQKGIIHRDIKPSNILVAVQEGVAVPKVIDFGIAKAIDHRLTDKTVFTSREQFIGTPAYVSPEQAEMSALDIDTRSDIYSLGILLYELLTGTTPFDTAQLLRAGIEEMRRRIREEEPPRPSTRLTTLAEAQRLEVAKVHRTDPGKLASLIKGDLDWIVMKALEKDRTRRYPTANAFAMDLQRHLNHEPVIAAAPSVGYRLGKFARRNRMGLAVAAVVLAVVLLGAAASLWQAVRAESARRSSETNRSRAENLVGFMMGDLYEQLNLLSRLNVMEPLVGMANAYYEGLNPNELTADAEFNWSVAQAMHGILLFNRGMLEAAESNLLAVLTTQERLIQSHPTNVLWQRELAGVCMELSRIARRSRQNSESVLYLDRSRQILEKVVDPASPDLKARAQLGRVYVDIGRYGAWVANREDQDAVELLRLDQARATFEELLRHQPENESWVQSLAIAVKQRAIKSRANRRESTRGLREALVIVTNRASYASSAGLRNESAWIHLHLGEDFSSLPIDPDLQAAEAHFQAALAILEPLNNHYQADYLYARQGVPEGLAQTHRALGRLRTRDRPFQAVDHFRKAWEVTFASTQRNILDVAWNNQEESNYKEFEAACIAALREHHAPAERQVALPLWRDLLSIASQRRNVYGMPSQWLSAIENTIQQVLLRNRNSQLHALLPTNVTWRCAPAEPTVDRAWTEFDFAQESSWKQGMAVLGYGEPLLINTSLDGLLLSQPNTVWFRHRFGIEKPGEVSEAWLRLLVDDGAVVYLNGREITRVNMPDGNIHHDTQALEAIEAFFYHEFFLPNDLRMRSENVIAVEVHQASATSSDLVFGLELLTLSARDPGRPLAADAAESTAHRYLAALYLMQHFQSRFGPSGPCRFVPSSYTRLSELMPVPRTSQRREISGSNTVWRFLHSREDPGEAWMLPGYHDSNWKQVAGTLGPAGRLTTTLAQPAEDPQNQPSAGYFRMEFTVENPAESGALYLCALLDDGGVLYLNGQELLRENMPPGKLHPGSRPLGRIVTEAPVRFVLDQTHLRRGKNVLAAEVHAQSPNAPSLRFDLEGHLGMPHPSELLGDREIQSVRRYLSNEGIPLPEEIWGETSGAASP